MRILGSQKGAASLIAVVMTSFLLLIITIAISTMMIGELRRAVDAENSVVAYYETESGVELAINQAKTKIESAARVSDLNQDCTGATTGLFGGAGDPEIPLSIRCLSFSTFSTSPEVFNLSPRSARQYDLTQQTISANSRIDVSWDAPKESTGFRPNAFVEYPPSTGQTIIPGLIELTVIQIGSPLTVNGAPGPVDPSKLKIKTLVLKPENEASSPGNVGKGKCNLGSTGYQAEVSVKSCNIESYVAPRERNVSVGCNPGTAGYRCKVSLKDFDIVTGTAAESQRNYIVRIRPLLASVDYRIQVFNNGVPIGIALDYAKIDVTAQVGNSLRRVEQEVRVRANPFASLGDALISNSEVCKTFDIVNDGTTSTANEIENNFCSL